MLHSTLFVLLAGTGAAAFTSNGDNEIPYCDYDNEPIALEMPSDGNLRIIQFADLHFRQDERAACRNVEDNGYPCNSFNTTQFMERVVAEEDPDFVVFTGDNIDSWALRPSDALNYMAGVASPKGEIPVAFLLGNHDPENKLSPEQLIDVCSEIDGSITQHGPQWIHGDGNYVAEVYQEGSPMFTMYFLDSGDYADRSVGGYGWIWTDQVAWYRNTAKGLKDKNGRVNPAVAFFHIPIPEFDLVENYVGDWQEAISSPRVNSGFLVSAVETGDVKAVFVGHDHVNDFCGEVHGVDLCFAGGVGYDTYGKEGWPRRARVINLNADGSITTWKRLDTPALDMIDVQTLHEE